MEFTQYKRGDEKAILDLFQRAFGRKLSYDYWLWRYEENPHSDLSLINLAWENSRLVAHYAVSPTRLFLDGQEYEAGLSMTTMTDPEYQGRGLFTKLATLFYENYSEKLDVVMGVPNDKSIRGFQKLNFNLIKEIPMLVAEIPKRGYEISPNCVELKYFDEKFDLFFQLVIEKYPIITSRNSEKLNWRFRDNPENDYKIFAYIENNKVLGYLVTKTFHEVSRTIGDIVDILVVDESILAELLKIAFLSFQSEDIHIVNTWMNDKKLLNALEGFGFSISGHYYYFIVRDNKGQFDNKLLDFNNWYLTMSDIDIF